jgi:hypothetical protein
MNVKFVGSKGTSLLRAPRSDLVDNPKVILSVWGIEATA